MTEPANGPQEDRENGGPVPGAFLSGAHLKHLVDERRAIYLDSDPEDDGERQPLGLEGDSTEGEWADWTIDLALGREVFLSSEEKVRFLEEHESVAINPGEFALLMTEETVDIPSDRAAFISLKFKHALKGLINISGFHVDPNFHGKLVFSVYNAGPSTAILRRGEPAFMIVFAALSSEIKKNRKGAHFKDIERLRPEWLSGLQGRTSSLEALDEEVQDLRVRLNLLMAIGIGVLIAIITGWVTGAFA